MVSIFCLGWDRFIPAGNGLGKYLAEEIGLMRLAHPLYGLLLLGVPLIVAFLWYSRNQQRRLWELFADPEFRRRLLKNFSSIRGPLKSTLKVLSLVFIIFALMEPQWGSREEEVKMHGVNLMVLVDVSNSMLAADIPPNRLEREKQKLGDLLNKLQGDRVGLIAFAGRSFLLSPLTVDYGTLKRYMDELNTETIPIQGTDIAGALGLALKSFPEGKEGKTILLMSDGEDHSEKMKDMIKELKDKDIQVYVLGIGTPQGAPIPEAEGGFKLDQEGQTVVSKLGEDFLKDLALQTKGAYVRAVSSDEDLRELYIKGIRGAMNAQDLKVSRQTIWESRFYWPLAIAIALLAVERLIPSVPGKPREARYA
jgi:Ca-activated chloride channel homolog